MTLPQFPWAASWIEPREAATVPAVQRPAYHLVGVFRTTQIRKAILYATAHGIYEAFVNGERVGDAELTPGFTAYRERLQVQSFDVTPLLENGDNAWGFLLSDGWWRGQNHMFRFTDSFGSTVGVSAELHVTHHDGTDSVYRTDESWRWAPSHILRADLIAGEVHDLRALDTAWCATTNGRADWDAVKTVEFGNENLCATVGPPVRRMGELHPASITEVAPGRHIVDFGQVSNGWVRLTDTGPAGTVLTLVHGEALTADGSDVDIASAAGSRPDGDDGGVLPFQTDTVVSAGDGVSFEPRHSTKGFRYVRVDGHPGPLRAESITSVVVHNDVRPIGSFDSSSDDLNRLHRAADWSLRTNLCSVPTDCPTRERAGYTGDWQIFVDTAAYLYDVTDFSLGWLHSVAADQQDSGAILSFSPDPGEAAVRLLPWWERTQGAAGWGDAIVHVPWELYRSTGDPAILEPFLTSMQRWVDFAAARAASDRHADRAAVRPIAAPHERFIWDTGFHFGEWLEPDGSPDFGDLVRQVIDFGVTATAFLYRSSTEFAQIAEVTGHRDLAARYRGLAGDVLDAWRAEFLESTVRTGPTTQAVLVRAIAFGLVPEEHRQHAADRLAQLVREAGTHVGTGFLATPFLLPVLAENGHLDLAYDLLFQRTEPSWLAMLDAGATTVWESWHPRADDGTVNASLNHFSMGAVISFFHRYICGLQIDEPGYRRFIVEPRIDPRVSHASTSHESPFGEISVAWITEGGSGRIDVFVPSGTGAELRLPGGTRETLTEGAHRRSW